MVRDVTWLEGMLGCLVLDGGGYADVGRYLHLTGDVTEDALVLGT